MQAGPLLSLDNGIRVPFWLQSGIELRDIAAHLRTVPYTTA